MKLDYDCVRNILLTVESLNFNTQLNNDNAHFFPLLHEYHDDKLQYTIKRMAEAGFISNECVLTMVSGNVRYYISELSWDGHQFLDHIRDENVWQTTKSKTDKFLNSIPAKLLVAITAKIIQSQID